MFLRLLMITAVVLGLMFSTINPWSGQVGVPTVSAWGGPGGDSAEDDAAETGEDGGGGADEAEGGDGDGGLE